MDMFPAVEQNYIVPSGFSSHTVNKCPFHSLFSAMFVCIFVGDLTVLSGQAEMVLLNPTRLVGALLRKYASYKFFQTMSYSATGRVQG